MAETITQSDSASPTPPQPSAKNPLSPVLVAISGIILVVATFVAGFWLGNRQVNPTTLSPTPTPSASTSPTLKPSSEKTSFTGKSLAVSFEYPAEWGTAKEEITPIGDAQNYHGNQYHISFSRNPYLKITGASKDSSTPGIGGACPIRTFFKGTADTGLLNCSQCPKDQEGCVNCKEAPIGGQPTVSYLYRPTTHCGALGFQQIVFLKTPYNTNNTDISGIVFELSITSPENSQFADLGYRSASSCPGDGNEQEQQRKYLTGIFDEKIQTTEKSLTSTTNQDYLSAIQLAQLDSLLATLKFTQ